jgi:DNA (cytosine-5)-methyltransferase 1
MNEKEILLRIYDKAKELKATELSENIIKDIDDILSKIENNKSLVSALTTSLLKKIIHPKQDIRLHRTDFDGGYSARVLDTNITTPFFKDKFSKYANKESAFLTLATREKIKWTKREGVQLKIRDKKLKSSFLAVLDKVENRQIKPEDYLLCLFFKLINIVKTDSVLFGKTKSLAKNSTLNINVILKALLRHFEYKLSSRLPVIAIYSIYEILIDKFERYKNKTLVPLHVHTASDKRAFGDIEIYSGNKPFEIVEIKHNIPIGADMVFDIAKKTKDTSIDRYYILTTYKDSFKSLEESQKIAQYILNLKSETGIDIIANGIIPTLKYYLRFIDKYEDFLNCYTKNLIADAENSTEVKRFHLQTWNNIRDER